MGSAETPASGPQQEQADKLLAQAARANSAVMQDALRQRYPDLENQDNDDPHEEDDDEKADTDADGVGPSPGTARKPSGTAVLGQEEADGPERVAALKARAANLSAVLPRGGTTPPDDGTTQRDGADPRADGDDATEGADTRGLGLGLQLLASKGAELEQAVQDAKKSRTRTCTC